MNDDTNATKAVNEARELNAQVRGYIRTAKFAAGLIFTMGSMALLGGGVASLLITHGQVGDLFVVVGALGMRKASRMEDWT